ncbi:MAG TPA: branched-chain amino acid ABC transporter substrate-binding protein, partial [Methylomirabilota bacterium]|nr:branched-chain amino acid ABC transporter substrate-binding protein [Methylomirabilota bacterium]
MIPQILRSLLLACLVAVTFAAPAWAQGTLKIAYVDPLSGGAASAGILGQKHFNYFVDKINAAG